MKRKVTSILHAGHQRHITVRLMFVENSERLQESAITQKPAEYQPRLIFANVVNDFVRNSNRRQPNCGTKSDYRSIQTATASRRTPPKSRRTQPHKSLANMPPGIPRTTPPSRTSPSRKNSTANTYFARRISFPHRQHRAIEACAHLPGILAQNSNAEQEIHEK
jgi:hypothetical protein